MTDREFLVDVLPKLPYVSYEMAHEYAGCDVELPNDVRVYASFDTRVKSLLFLKKRPRPVWTDGGLTASSKLFLQRTVVYSEVGLSVSLQPIDLDDLLYRGIVLVETWLKSGSYDSWDLQHIDPKKTSIGRVAELYGY